MARVLTNFFSDLSDRFRVLAFAIFIVALSTLLSLWTTEGILPAFLVGAILLAFVLITRSIWLPPGYAKASVQRYSLFIVLVTATAALGLSSPLSSIFIAVTQQIANKFSLDIYFDSIPIGLPVATVISFVLISVFFVNYLLREVHKPASADKAYIYISKARSFDPQLLVPTYSAKGVTQYLPVESDRFIEDYLLSKQDFIVVGRAGIGKSHSLVNAIKKVYPKWTIVVPSRRIAQFDEILDLSRKKYILLLDDIDRFVSEKDP